MLHVISELSWLTFTPFSFILHISAYLTHTSSHSTVSEAMRLATDPADFLATPYRFLFNSTLVTDTLNYLTPGNSVVFIGTQKLNFNGSSHPTVTQDSLEPVPWPVLTQVCAIHSMGINKYNNYLSAFKMFCFRCGSLCNAIGKLTCFSVYPV